MKKLIEYLNNNRKSMVSESETVSNFGDLFINTRALYYHVNTSDMAYKVFAFMGYPKTPKPRNGYPAVVLMHGGDGKAYLEFVREWTNKGYVVIAPDYNAKCSLSLKQRGVENPLGGPVGYGSYNDMHEKHPWAYFSVLSSMCAVDFLCSLEIVDTSNIYSVGLSWGGYLNLLFLSQEKRIKAGSIIYAAAYSHESEWGKVKLANLNETDRQYYIENFEASNYLNSIDCPVLFTAGADDLAFKMSNRMKTAEKINGKAYFALRKEFPHSNFWGFDQPESAEFFNKIREGKSVPQPNVTMSNNNGIRVFDKRKKSKLNIVYTVDDIFETERQQWKKKKVLTDKEIYLPKASKAFFVTMESDGFQWSSNLFLGNLNNKEKGLKHE